MPKIALRYVGNDEQMKKRLEETDGLQYFEPVDAREILAAPGQSDYEIDDESRKRIGAQYEARPKQTMVGADGKERVVSIPQLQGGDEELQTGLSIEKYRRDQVVKAVPDPAPTAMRAMTTTGRPLNLEAAQSGEHAGSGDPRHGMQQEAPKKASEGMGVEEMKSALRARNIQFPNDAKKAELAELVDRHNAR